MNDPLNPNRRDLLRVMATGASAGAASSVATPLAAAATETANDAKKKARYQADSPEVQTFYRVNRYPTK